MGADLYLAGPFTFFNFGLPTQVPLNGIAKLNLNPVKLDPTFNLPSAGVSGQAVTLSATGASLFIGGSITRYRGGRVSGGIGIDLTSAGQTF